MFNKSILVGNLTRDIELRYLPSGTALGNSAIGVNRKFKKSDGTKGEETLFIDITFFGRQAEVANQYLKKGSKVLIEGRLKLERWTDPKSGQNRSKHSISVENMEMLSSKNETQQGEGVDSYGGGYNGGVAQQQPQQSYQRQMPQGQNMANSQTQQTQQQEEIPSIDINDEEIPF